MPGRAANAASGCQNHPSANVAVSKCGFAGGADGSRSVVRCACLSWIRLSGSRRTPRGDERPSTTTVAASITLTDAGVVAGPSSRAREFCGRRPPPPTQRSCFDHSSAGWMIDRRRSVGMTATHAPAKLCLKRETISNMALRARARTAGLLLPLASPEAPLAAGDGCGRVRTGPPSRKKITDRSAASGSARRRPPWAERNHRRHARPTQPGPACTRRRTAAAPAAQGL